MTKTIAMIPARMGSQRLKKKNLCEILPGITLIEYVINKCLAAECFDEVWINSENEEFSKFADNKNIFFHKRPEKLGDNNATSEQFIYEFLQSHESTHIVQVHSIAPLLTINEIKSFTNFFVESDNNVLLSYIADQIECVYLDKPVNFTFNKKTNSQDLSPIQRVTWSITGWKSDDYIRAYEAGECATYSGKIGFYEVDKISGHVIKTQHDLDIAKALLETL
ncbi:MAG: cytidyltransferase [Rickettsiales bacterium]|jgi:CMP-N-acetylneuraminic acid synthetase|nr:cytidyltransferase [Rickettsiales bacterium]